MAKKKNKNVRFVRIRGRIVPIAIKREAKVLREIAQPKNIADIGVVGSGVAGAAGSLFLSGKAQKISNKAHKLIRSRRVSSSARRGFIKTSFKFNKLAKGGKAAALTVFALVSGSAVSRIDRRVKSDENAKILNIGGNTKKPSFGSRVLKVGGAILLYRAGKRFEVAGKRGLNLFKMKDIRKLKSVRDV